jgi:aromatic ring-opening dioxygenase LigB subunit
MSVVTAGILPHGEALIPGFIEEGNIEEFKRLRNSLRIASRIILQKNPDTIVIATPHNLRIKDHIGVIASENCAGSLSSGRKTVKVSVRTDLELAEAIYQESYKNNIHVVKVNYGTDSGPLSCMPLDWGTVVPLFFLGCSHKVVILTPSRELPLSELVDFGKIVRSASDRIGRRIAFIASADQAHTHDKSGPYGFDKTAEQYDIIIQKIVKQAKLDRLLGLPLKMIQKAKPDGLWQMLILHGALSEGKYRTVFSYYGRPSYYGMLVAVLS